MVPVENILGPKIWPLRCISAAANISELSLEGSWMVVTPKARLERFFQFCCGIISSFAWEPWAWPSIKPGVSVLPLTSISLASAGITTSPILPTATMRLFCTTTTPLVITSWALSASRIVMTCPPTNAIVELGLSAARENPKFKPSDTGSGNSSGAPAKKLNAWFNSRLNTVAPWDQLSLSLSADQLTYSPARLDTWATGKPPSSALNSCSKPVLRNGATKALFW